QAEDGIRYRNVTGVQTCALPICTTRLDTLLFSSWELACSSPDWATLSYLMTHPVLPVLISWESSAFLMPPVLSSIWGGEPGKAVSIPRPRSNHSIRPERSTNLSRTTVGL